MKRTITSAAVLLLCVALFPIGGSGASARPADEPAKAVVTIDNFSFGHPITVPVGTTVVWTNKDDVPHNVVSKDKLFKSPILDTGEHFEFTFKTAGTFDYYCSIHPRMTGQVVVK